jgi:hypothetical protein
MFSAFLSGVRYLANIYDNKQRLIGEIDFTDMAASVDYLHHQLSDNQ